jgi:hypothetical protein
MATDLTQLIANPELAGFERQRKMAQMLVQQGMQTPQSQMVGDRYVPANPLQYLGNLFNVYAGQKGLEDVDKKELSMAKALREKELSDLNRFAELQYGTPDQMVQQAGPMMDGGNIAPQMVQGQAPNPMAAYQLGLQSTNPLVRSQLAEMLKGQKLGEGEVIQRYNPATGKTETVGQGAAKYRAPIQIDTGTAIELRDPLDPTKVLQRVPKAQAPTAGQIVETANGPMLINTRTGQAQPIMVDGQPLAPKLTAEQNKDITAINQQRSTIDGAIADVKKNKSAFSFTRGLAQDLPYGESIAGRLEKPEDTQARAYVFNNVSSVIKERAGTAQSAQELKRVNSFLPATTDNADQIVSKLEGFKQYLKDQESGTRIPASRPAETGQLNTFSNEADAQKAFNDGKLKAGQKITINGVSGTWK